MPLLVEAAETLFIPVAIRNNVKGYEGEVLAYFEEPTWNNPVVRFLNGQAKDVIPRKDRVWQTDALLGRMIEALRAARQTVPAWLTALLIETETAELQTAVFAMT